MLRAVKLSPRPGSGCVLTGSESDRVRAALLKGAIMLLFGLSVLGGAAWRMLAQPEVPVIEAMSLMGLAAFLGNLGCFYLLWRHRDADLNMRSTWLCSRNDLIANAGVLLAAAGVHATGSSWPDILVGIAIAGLFLATAAGVLKASADALMRPEVRKA